MLCPLFSLGCWRFPRFNKYGRNYLLNLLGIMIWPLGWGVAGLITQGMIDFMTDQSFLSSSSAPNTLLFFPAKFDGTRVPGHLDYFQHHYRAHRHPKGDSDGKFRRFRYVQRSFLGGPGGGNGRRNNFCRKRATTGIKTAIAAVFPPPPQKHW